MATIISTGFSLVPQPARPCVTRTIILAAYPNEQVVTVVWVSC